MKGKDNCQGGAKGVLDYLILPLLARKLIADVVFGGPSKLILTNVLACAIVIPIELARFSAGIALTLLLSPVVALVHLIKACLPKEQHHEVAPTSNLTAS